MRGSGGPLTRRRPQTLALPGCRSLLRLATRACGAWPRRPARACAAAGLMPGTRTRGALHVALARRAGRMQTPRGAHMLSCSTAAVWWWFTYRVCAIGRRMRRREGWGVVCRHWHTAAWGPTAHPLQEAALGCKVRLGARLRQSQRSSQQPHSHQVAGRPCIASIALLSNGTGQAGATR